MDSSPSGFPSFDYHESLHSILAVSSHVASIEEAERIKIENSLER